MVNRKLPLQVDLSKVVFSASFLSPKTACGSSQLKMLSYPIHKDRLEEYGE